MKKLVEKVKHILVVPNTFDPDDLRRRQVLNTFVIFLMVMNVMALTVSFWNKDVILDLQNYSDARGIFVTCIGAFVLSAVLLGLNRSSRIPKNLNGWIFILGMTAIFSISDLPNELTGGRSIFIWAIPITLSVVILPPASVFVVDLIITAVFLYYAEFQWYYFQIYTLTEIYVVSFISWLGMSIAERAIRDARNESRKNAAILEGVAEGVIVVGRDNQIVLANQAASELIRDDMTIVPGMESTEVGGRALSFHWSKVEGVGWVAIVRDISRQIEIDHAKDAILRVVSHEMRTPLAAILGFAEVLESRPVPGMATRIRANGQRLLKLVNDLLDMAQIQAGALTMQTETFSTAVLKAYILENFLNLAGEKGVVLEVQCPPSGSLEQVSGDVKRLEQVVSNLVDNAIKFTEKGGRVDVSLCVENGVDWQIVVKDTGMGISPERLPDIFEPFRRASDYAKRKHQGVGLGLSIAKKIVQLSGGSISVESTVGKGSTFTVTFPKA